MLSSCIIIDVNWQCYALTKKAVLSFNKALVFYQDYIVICVGTE